MFPFILVAVRRGIVELVFFLPDSIAERREASQKVEKKNKLVCRVSRKNTK